MIGFYAAGAMGQGGGSPAPPVGGPHAHWRVNVSEVQASFSLAISLIEMRATPGGANQCVGGTASAKSVFGSYDAINAFTSDVGTAWMTTEARPQWVAYTFPAPVSVTQVLLRVATTAHGGHNQDPKDFTIEYSDDGISWVVAATVTNQTGWGNNEARLFAV